MKRTYLIILALILVLALGFTGCSEFNYGPIATDADNLAAPVESNGGLVAKQGNYVYFVNGIGTAAMDNKFGEVIRGAIMRYTLDNNGDIVDDSLVTVVPKVVFSNYADCGFAIFGEWIYYVSPSVKIDKQGNRLTNVVDFYRAKLDGTGTQKITEVENASVEYVFTKDALLYQSGSEIYSVDLTGDTFTVNTLAEEITGYMFPKLQDYDADDTTVSIDEYVFYTKADEDDYESANHLYAVKPDGTGLVEIMGPNTYTDNANDYRNRISVTPIKIENGVLYYNKAYAENGALVAEGLYAGLYCYDLSDWSDEFEFDAANEVKLSINQVTSLHYVTDGVILVNTGSAMQLHNFGGADKINNVASFASAIEIMSITDVEKTADALTFRATFTRAMSDDLYSYKFSYTIADGIYTVNEADLEQAVSITDTGTVSTYLNPEVIDGWFYFQNEWGYISRVKIGTDEEPEMLGKMTTADQEKYEESLEDEE